MTKNNGSRFPGSIRHIAIITLLLIMAGCAGSAAGAGAMAGAGSAIEAGSLAGTWEGSFDTSQFSGEMVLTLTYESGSYTGVLMGRAMDEEFTEEIGNFKSEGSEFTFYTFMAGADIYFAGKVEEGKMTGTFGVYQDGTQADEATFSFVKK